MDSSTNGSRRRGYKLSLRRSTPQREGSSTGTISSIGQPQEEGQLHTASKVTDYPLLRTALQSTAGDRLIAHSAGSEVSLEGVLSVPSTTRESGSTSGSTTKTPYSIFRGISTNDSGQSSRTQVPKTQPLYSDVNGNRGEKITTKTLTDYLVKYQIFTAEDFIKHATQGAPNRGREIYLALAYKDWDKKISQAVDVAINFTPDTPFRARVENYKVPDGFDLWKGTCTYNEYLELFRHHGIFDDKLRRFFKTLCGDNGKKNTIYMWGKADAGKTTIIKLFDAFYHKWEIGRCAAQSINSNFWLQDLYMKRLFHADEIIATQVNIDTLKLLLEGSDDLTTDIKYAKKVSITGRPVLMATNEPIWINMSTAAEPIRKRCEFIQMKRAWTGPTNFMSTREKDMLQYVQNRLWRELFPNGYDEWLLSESFNKTVEEADIDELMTREPVDIDNFVSEMN